MKIIENKILPPKDYLALNLFGIVFVKVGNRHLLDKYSINHELIHTAQMKEMLFIFFYIWYITEWLIKLLIYKQNYLAYQNISFEREAYAYQNNLKYLTTRKMWSWCRFLKI